LRCFEIRFFANTQTVNAESTAHLINSPKKQPHKPTTATEGGRCSYTHNKSFILVLCMELLRKALAVVFVEENLIQAAALRKKL
jgi:hypothetical protein